MEHDPAREEHRGERHADGQERETGDLKPDSRSGAQQDCDHEPGGEARRDDRESETDHGSKR